MTQSATTWWRCVSSCENGSNGGTEREWQIAVKDSRGVAAADVAAAAGNASLSRVLHGVAAAAADLAALHVSAL